MLVRFAERHGQLLIVGPGLVWDQGFGDGWTDDDIWGMDKTTAEAVLYGTSAGPSIAIAGVRPPGWSPMR